MVWGTSPPCSSTKTRLAPMMDLALLRKKPVAWMRSSTSAGSAFASSAGLPKRANRPGATRLTVLSVLCALKMVASSSCQGSSKSNSTTGVGMA